MAQDRHPAKIQDVLDTRETDTKIPATTTEHYASAHAGPQPVLSPVDFYREFTKRHDAREILKRLAE